MTHLVLITKKKQALFLFSLKLTIRSVEDGNFIYLQEIFYAFACNVRRIGNELEST